MKKITFLVAALLAALFVTFGCGGSGTDPVSLFAGPKFVGFYDEDGSNSSWGGACEVVIRPDGTFESNGVLYTSTFGSGASKAVHDQIVEALAKGKTPKQPAGPAGGGGGGYISHEGTVLNGFVSNDGTIHYEAKVTLNTSNWPSAPLDIPYFMVGDGQVSRHGFGWKGTGIIRYYEVAPNGSMGALSKQIPYDFEIMNGPG